MDCQGFFLELAPLVSRQRAKGMPPAPDCAIEVAIAIVNHILIAKSQRFPKGFFVRGGESQRLGSRSHRLQ